MLEQLKEVIIEMELLLRDSCTPVISRKEDPCYNDAICNDITNENASNVYVDMDAKEPLIRVDSCLRKVLSVHTGTSAEEELSLIHI